MTPQLIHAVHAWRRPAALAVVVLWTLFAGFGLSGTAYAATRTWTGLGLTTNWTDAGNWSGNVLPGPADVATFDATSAKNATINAAVNIGGVSIGAGYAGTITQGPGFAMTVGGSGLNQAGGTVVGGTAAMTINGTFTLTGGSFGATSGTLSISSNVTIGGGTFNAGTGRTSFGGGAATLSASIPVSFNNVTLAAGNKTLAVGSTLNVAGALSLTGGSLNGGGTLAAQGDVSQASTYGGGVATLLLNGSATQTLTGAATSLAGNLPLLVINKPSGTLTLAGTLRSSNGWTYTAGTLDPGSSTVVFAGGTINGSHTLNSVDLRATTSVAAGTTLTVSGSTILTGGSLNGGGTLAAQGDVSQASTYGGGVATLLLNGSATQTLTGAATSLAGNLPLLVINKPSGTLTLAGTLRSSNGWTYTAGTLDPGSSTVVFAGGTINGSHTLNSVDLRATTSVAAGTTLTVSGSTILTGGSLNGGGTLAAQGDVSQASTYGGGVATLLLNGSATQTLTGAATSLAGNLPLLVINKPSGTLTLAGTLRSSNGWTYTAGTLDPGSSTVVFAGGTINGSHTLNSVDLRATTSVAAGTTLTVSGSTILTGGSLNGGGTLAAQGDVSQASTYGGGAATLLLNGSATQTLTGAATSLAGNLPLLVINKPSGTLTLAGTLRSSNGWTYTAGTLDPGSSTVVFAGGTINASGMSFYDVTASGGTTTLGAAMRIGHDLKVNAGTFTTSAASHALTVDGSVTIGGTLRLNGSAVAIRGDVTNNGTIVPGSSTLTLDGSVGQLIGGSATLSAFNLVVNDTAGVALARNLTVTRTLTLSSGPLSIGANLLTISNAIAGTPGNLVAGAASSLSVTGAGAGIVLPGSVSQLSALTLNNPNGLRAQANITIGTLLTLSAGRLDAGASTVIIGPGGSVARTAGWVIGRLEKHAANGSGVILTFEIGDATRYAPVAIGFGTVGNPGDLTASTTSGDHPDLANSGLAVNRSVNRYWTVTNSGISFDTYDATFTFAAGDIDPGADPTVFNVAKLDVPSWTLPSIGSRTALSTTAVGMTSFSDFAVGEPTADLGVTVSDGLSNVTAGDGQLHGYLVTVDNSGPSDATGVILVGGWPGGLSQGAITSSQGSCAAIGSGPDFSCSLGVIAAGASATVSVDYSVPPSATGGPRSETVSVSSSVSDPAAANDSATDTTTVVEVATLVVGKDDGLASVTAGDGLGHTYTITVTNQGPSDADNLEVADNVPAAISAGPPTADQSGDCSGSLGNSISCALPASLAPGATWTISFPYSVGAGVPAQALTNTATATSDENPAGVAASDLTDVTGSADLGVTVSDGLSNVTAGDGQLHGYLVTVDNSGPSDATGVILVGGWPGGLSQGAISSSQGSCAAIGSGPDFSCSLGVIAAGASATISVDYSVPPSATGGPRSETVSVSSSVSDPAAANDSATDTTTVVEVATPPPTPTPAPTSTPRQTASPSAPDTAAAAPAGDRGTNLGLAFLLLAAFAAPIVVAFARRRRPGRRRSYRT